MMVPGFSEYMSFIFGYQLHAVERLTNVNAGYTETVIEFNERHGRLSSERTHSSISSTKPRRSVDARSWEVDLIKVEPFAWLGDGGDIFVPHDGSLTTLHHWTDPTDDHWIWKWTTATENLNLMSPCCN